MRGRTKSDRRTLVIPYGTGIGDMINMRPLLSAIARAHPDRRVVVLAHESMAWLTPPNVDLVPSVHGVRPWRRLRAGSAAARALSALTVPNAAGMMRPLLSGRTARLMTSYLELQEFPVVINLLELLIRLDDAHHRWGRNGDTVTPNVVDLIADALQEAGIPVPRATRAPRIDVSPLRLHDGRSALLGVCAGSTLKEAPISLWRELAAGLAARGFRTHVVVPPDRRIDAGLVALPSVELLRAPLPRLARVIAGAAVVVSVDTGILHLAAATGTPHVGLYGATDSGFSGPYPGSRGELVTAPFEHPALCGSCWAAQMLPSARCPLFAPATCLSTLGAADVLAAVDRVSR